MAKILTARQAVDTYFYDGATVTFGGFANGLMHPEEIMVALEEAARSSGHPRGLRVVYASGQGDSGERGPIRRFPTLSGAKTSLILRIFCPN